MITLMGATGHVGGRIASELLRDGERVRALGRSENRLAALDRAGAETVAGDAGDVGFLTRAFRGADAAFTLLPPDPQARDYRATQDRHGEAIVEALRRSGVPRVVFLSSLGADQAEGTGPIAGLHAQERRLQGLDGAQVLALRPGYFFENLHEALGTIRSLDVHADAFEPDVRIPMVAARDVADVAAKALRERGAPGFAVRELLGPRDLTPVEVARIVGERIGKPDLRYVRMPYEDLARALRGAGLSDNVADLYVEMSRAINEGRVKTREGRNPSNTTRTPLEDFAEELAGVYRRA